MRITRLLLERYGHLDGELLEFPADKGLHLVLGANEAGKSTALDAVADALFGFPMWQRGGRAHPDDPRVRIDLRAADGTEASFTRRKAGRNKLLDAAGDPVPEAAMARFLGGTARERFAEVFGLNGERLRKGGRAMVAEQGEAGAAILLAGLGLGNLREAANRLDTEAKSLFGDGRGQRLVSAEADRIKENRRLAADRSVSGDEYTRVQAREAELAADAAAADAERQALRTEQARLNRVRATTPLRRELAALEAELRALGPDAPLPPDAGARCEKWLAMRDRAVRDREREEGEAATLARALAALQPDPAVLAEAGAVAALHADLSRVAEARDDHRGVSGQARASRDALDALARRLGVAERGAALDARLPDLATRRMAERLLQGHGGLRAALDGVAAALRRAEAEAKEAGDALAGLPVPADADALRDAVADARNAGPVGAETARTAAVLARAEGQGRRLLARLALWQGGGLDALEATTVPLDATAARLGAALDDAGVACGAANDAWTAHEAAAAACRAAMTAIEQGGTLPTADAVAALRAQRDAAWHDFRRAEPGGADGLAGAFEALLRDADRLADARHGELARVQEWERQRHLLAGLDAGRPALLARQEAAARAWSAAGDLWVAAWQPAGIVPGTPAAMREWVRERATVLGAAAAIREAASVHADAAALEARLCAGLVAALPPGAGRDLPTLLRDAASLLRERDGAAATRGHAEERLAKARREVAVLRADMDAAQGSLVGWNADWAPLAVQLGLPSQADPEVATDLLAGWSDLDRELDHLRTLDGRLADMGRTIAGHEAAVGALAGRLGVAVADGLPAALALRLRAAEGVAAEQERLAAAVAARNQAAAGHHRAEAEAEGELAALRRLAGVPDDAGLHRAVAAQAARTALEARRRDRADALARLADGKTGAEMAEEEEACDIDAIPGRLDAVAVRMGELDGAVAAVAGELAEVRQRLRAMGNGQDVAGPSQAIQDSLAVIEDAAHRYVRLRLAHALLRGGIEAYRRSQQGPLLARAGGLFETLTGGRYHRLEQDETEKGEPVIVAVRPDGTACPMAQLSEGTTDQLFLALRLASIAGSVGGVEPMPFIADDLLVNFDDHRAAAALGLLAAFGQTNQVILFTHHRHLLPLLAPGAASVHHLPAGVAPATIEGLRA